MTSFKVEPRKIINDVALDGDLKNPANQKPEEKK